MSIRPPRTSWIVASAGLSVLTLAGFAAPALAASSPTPLSIARFAFDTAVHAHPARMVRAADVLNAFETPLLNPSLGTGTLSLVANLGTLPGAPRDVMVTNPSTYRRTCVNFPKRIGAIPTVVTCPTTAITTWMYEPNVLDVSRNAIAAAARHGRSVSGADVVRAVQVSNTHLASLPTFSAGRGGVVTFVVPPATKSNGTANHLCVDMPRYRYGIPRLVSC